MTDVDRQIARAGELLERTRAGREALVKRRRSSSGSQSEAKAKHSPKSDSESDTSNSDDDVSSNQLFFPHYDLM